MKCILMFATLIFLCGCSTMQGWFGDNYVTEKLNLAPERPPRYSESPQMSVPSNREYRRMTKSRMEEEAELHSQAGSMWVNEGQSSYLFVQNKTRREGDIVNVKMDGAALKQVETKVAVIKKLLKQLEEQEALKNRQRLAENGGGDARGPASEEPKKEEPKKEEKEDLSDLASVPTRITEKLPDGNYRVKGQQPFMIGKREYKVIVTGIVRPEDYNDEGISSAKLLDPQYDVVSVRRKQGNEQNAAL